MIRKRLAELSFETLLSVASHNGIKPDPDIGRGTLTDMLVDVINDNRTERDANNAPSVFVPQKKYMLFREYEQPLYAVEDFQLPMYPFTTNIVLMLRDVRWAYTYWNLSIIARKEYQDSYEFQGLFLRIIEVENSNITFRITNDFEIPVQLSDCSWYIGLPRQNTYYHVQLIARKDKKRELLAMSNRIFVSADVDTVYHEAQWLYELCGMGLVENSLFESSGGLSGY